ncbi:MAG: CHAT domain-containing protein [Caldilineaceae bacterium]|nr:CHAT domain-containing protein [Caldilineaceae bacterium]MBP8122834.1 CHAT domain-containing protein [Caldilineaceae bacterium]MBP9073758.1 CHAT domain-containing protein [Caldilineaceae bacterium]
MKQRQYIDFKLFLTRPPDGQGCQIALLPTPEVGETTTPVTILADQFPTETQLRQLANRSITARQLIDLGTRLANCLLPDGIIRKRFSVAYDLAGPEGGVRLRLIIADHSLKQWPWEYIYLKLLDGPDSLAGFLVLNERISVVRHEPLPSPHPKPGKTLADFSDVRLLVAAASPKVAGLSPLDVKKEVDLVKTAVQGFNLEGVRVTADTLMNVTRQQLADALLKQPYVFHFAGHGTSVIGRDDFNRGPEKQSVSLILAQDGAADKEDRLGAAELATMLRGSGTRLAVLGACDSGKRNERYPWDDVAGALASAEIPAIIAMQYEVVDEQATAFGRNFYTALGLGLSLDEAVWSGRAAMLQVTSADVNAPVDVQWGVPVLYSRLSDGALFPERMAKATAAAEAFLKVFSQTVTGIQAGKMTGVRVDLIENGVRVVQKVKELTGTVVGIEAGEAGAGARIEVEQEVESVQPGGVLCGATFDRL